MDPFITAVKNKNRSIAETFLKVKKCDVNLRDEDGKTALYYATINKDRDMVKLLLKYHADPNIKTNNEDTILKEASKKGSKEIITMLVASGANIDETDKEGKTPLINAILNNHVEAALELIKLGADTEIKDNSGHTMIDYASSMGLKSLLDVVDTDYLTKDDYGNTKLHQAVFNNQTETLRTILEKSNNLVNLKNNHNETPIMVAVQYGNLYASELLIAHGANLLDRLNSGDTLLHLASRINNDSLIKLFLKSELINAKNNSGETPLIIASKFGRKENVRQLLDHGAIDTKDNLGNDASYYASKNGFSEIVELLLLNSENI